MDVDMSLAPDLAAQRDQQQQEHPPASDNAMTLQEEGALDRQHSQQPEDHQGGSPPLPLTPSPAPLELDASNEKVQAGTLLPCFALLGESPT